MMKTFLTFLTFILLLIIAWAGGFAYYLYYIGTYQVDTTTPCEALVVLTGSEGRVERGFELFEQGRAPHLFITGVGDDRHSEAFLETYKPSQELKAMLAEPDAFTIDRAATSTFENADETKAWLEKTGYDTLCLVTAHYHMPRSLLVFRHAMPEKIWVPQALEGWDVKLERRWNHMPTIRILFREYNKMLAVWALNQVR